MRLKLLVNIVLDGARAAVIVTIILALGLSGASAAERLFADDQAAESLPASAGEQNSLVSGVDPEEDAGDMATGGRPWTEPAALLKSAPARPVGKNFHRLGNFTPPCHASLPNIAAPMSQVVLVATTGKVCWSLSRQFTLVGAKPSGTG